jgi:hypothetical protein
MVMMSEVAAGAGAGRPVRALHVTRHGAAAGGEVAKQRAVFQQACAARGWVAGGAVRQFAGGGGVRPWSVAVRLVLRGGYDAVVVASLEAVADDETGRMRVLGLLRRAGVRLVALADGVDTGEAVGRELADSLLAAGAAA